LDILPQRYAINIPIRHVIDNLVLILLD
jgi:hypothetical protein